MQPQPLQERLALLVDAAVERVLKQQSIPSETLFLDLQNARLEAAQLREELAEVVAADDAELKRLWALICESVHAFRAV